MELNWCARFGNRKKKKCKFPFKCQHRPRNCKTGHLTPMDEDNDCEIYKNARTKRVKLLFFFVKYANF
mgnify:CR=1 FL=1